MEASSSQDMKETTVAPKENFQLEAHMEVDAHEEDISEDLRWKSDDEEWTC